MNDTPTAALLVLQLLLVPAIAPLVSGIMKKTKARLQQRKGAGVLQPYFDLAKLFRKETGLAPTDYRRER